MVLSWRSRCIDRLIGDVPESIGNIKIIREELLKRLNTETETEKIVPPHQFQFRHEHYTVDQEHHVVNQIEKDLEEKGFISRFSGCHSSM